MSPGLRNLIAKISQPVYSYSVLTALFVLLNFLLYYKLGIKNVADSFRYLAYSAKIFSGYWYEPHNFWYVGYVVILAIIRLLSQSLIAIIVAQCLLSGLGLLALYRAAYVLYQSRSAALLAGLLYLIFFEVTTWNFYILAESAYMSLLCILLYTVAKFTSNRNWLWALLPLLLLVFFVKPTGIAILLAAGTFILYSYRSALLKNKLLVMGLALLLGIGFYYLANIMLDSFATSIIYNDYTRGEIIYGITTTNYKTSGQFLSVPPNTPLVYPSESWKPVPRLVHFILNNPAHFFKLWILKFWYFLAHQRPYWSLGHNLFCIFFLYPTYVAAGYSLKKSTIAESLKLACGAYFIVHIGIVTLTTVDWDGRFLMPLLPVIFLLAANGYRLMYQSLRV